MKNLLIILLLLLTAGCEPEKLTGTLIVTLSDGSEELIPNVWTYTTPAGGGMFHAGSGRKLVVYAATRRQIKVFSAGAWASVEWASDAKVRKLELKLRKLEEEAK